ncbi:cell adhesion molecule 3-like [Acanthaster planci]|uniref:Cell adhesion molecule 3-like n=1 Tax=Acanthaster planci TaxID=133434 RepID=A0A8B8A0W0_ACAPL|nr:cell adhesion molecule 3-like [Acanthaster planci]
MGVVGTSSFVVRRCWFAFTVFSVATFADITDLVDTTTVLGRDATLFCSNSEHSSGFAQWSDITVGGSPVPFATQADGVRRVPPETYGKYANFDLDSGSVTQLDLKISSAELEDEGTYSCTLNPDTKTATLTVEIEGAEPTITVDGYSSGNPIILRASEPSVLRCTARGFRPAVTLEWYKNSVQITTGVSPEAPTPNGDAFDTSGTLTFTPIRQDNEAILECRTTGQVVAPAKTAPLTLNVQYVPVVSVGYANEVITCSSDANPLATNHKIILNGTQVVKEFTTSQGSHLFTPVDGCTVISCNATNTVGTGTATFTDEVCLGYVEPTTNAPSKSPSTTKSPPAATNSGAVVGAVVGVFIAAIIICGLTIFCWMRKRRERQKPTRGQSTTGRDGKGYFKPDRQHHVELQRSGSNMVASSSKDDQPNGKCFGMILIENFSVPAVLDMLLIQICLVNMLDFVI